MRQLFTFKSNNSARKTNESVLYFDNVGDASRASFVYLEIFIRVNRRDVFGILTMLGLG